LFYDDGLVEDEEFYLELTTSLWMYIYQDILLRLASQCASTIAKPEPREAIPAFNGPIEYIDAPTTGLILCPIIKPIQLDTR
jgi:hypothetical protein